MHAFKMTGKDQDQVSAVVGHIILKPWAERFPQTAEAIWKVEDALKLREVQARLRELLARDPIARAQYQTDQIKKADLERKLTKPHGLSEIQKKIREAKKLKLEAERLKAQEKKTQNAAQGASPHKASGGGKKK